MNTGLGVRIALDTDCLTRTFARARVGRGALTADRQTAQMADAAIAFDALQSLEVHPQLPAQIALDHILALLDRVNDLGKLLLVQILRASVEINPRLLQDDPGIDRADAINVAKRDFDPLLARDFYANDTCHTLLGFNPVFVCGAHSCKSHESHLSGE